MAPLIGNSFREVPGTHEPPRLVTVDRLAAALAQYRANERLPPEELRRENLRRFRELARFVYEHSPYYRRVIDSHGIDVDRCRPEDFPPLHKADLARNFDDLLTTREISETRARAFFQREAPGALFAGRYVLMHSSGTSGPRSLFAIEQDEILRALLIAYRFSRHRGRRRSAVILRKSSHFPSTTMAIASRSGVAPTAEWALLDIDCSLDDLLRTLNDMQPDFVSTYAGMMARLGHEQRAGRLAISPRDVQVNGEILAPRQRRELEDAFGANVIDVYASCECLYMGWRSSDMQWMQLLEDDLIFEIHEDHLYCTNLFNRTLPLIRYRLDDRLERFDGPGDGRIKGVTGRVAKRILLENVHGERAELCSLLPYCLVDDLTADPRVEAAQLAILSDTVVECRAVLTPAGLSSEPDTLRWVEGKTRALMQSQGFARAAVTARSVPAILPDPHTGKTPVTLDRREHA